jgi:hypothetical protein
LAGTVLRLPAVRFTMIASHARVTVVTKTGDYNSWTALWNTRCAAFIFSIREHDSDQAKRLTSSPLARQHLHYKRITKL